MAKGLREILVELSWKSIDTIDQMLQAKMDGKKYDVEEKNTLVLTAIDQAIHQIVGLLPKEKPLWRDKFTGKATNDYIMGGVYELDDEAKIHNKIIADIKKRLGI